MIESLKTLKLDQTISKLNEAKNQKISFKSNPNNTLERTPETDKVEDKKGLSTKAKIAIASGVLLAAAAIVEGVVYKGKHVKNLFGKNKKPETPKPDTPKPQNPKPEAPKPEAPKVDLKEEIERRRKALEARKGQKCEGLDEMNRRAKEMIAENKRKAEEQLRLKTQAQEYVTRTLTLKPEVSADSITKKALAATTVGALGGLSYLAQRCKEDAEEAKANRQPINAEYIDSKFSTDYGEDYKQLKDQLMEEEIAQPVKSQTISSEDIDKKLSPVLSTTAGMSTLGAWQYQLAEEASEAQAILNSAKIDSMHSTYYGEDYKGLKADYIQEAKEADAKAKAEAWAKLKAENSEEAKRIVKERKTKRKAESLEKRTAVNEYFDKEYGNNVKSVRILSKDNKRYIKKIYSETGELLKEYHVEDKGSTLDDINNSCVKIKYHNNGSANAMKTIIEIPNLGKSARWSSVKFQEMGQDGKYHEVYRCQRIPSVLMIYNFEIGKFTNAATLFLFNPKPEGRVTSKEVFKLDNGESLIKYAIMRNEQPWNLIVHRDKKGNILYKKLVAPGVNFGDDERGGGPDKALPPLVEHLESLVSRLLRKGYNPKELKSMIQTKLSLMLPYEREQYIEKLIGDFPEMEWTIREIYKDFVYARIDAHSCTGQSTRTRQKENEDEEMEVFA